MIGNESGWDACMIDLEAVHAKRKPLIEKIKGDAVLARIHEEYEVVCENLMATVGTPEQEPWVKREKALNHADCERRRALGVYEIGRGGGNMYGQEKRDYEREYMREAVEFKKRAGIQLNARA